MTLKRRVVPGRDLAAARRASLSATGWPRIVKQPTHSKLAILLVMLSTTRRGICVLALKREARSVVLEQAPRMRGQGVVVARHAISPTMTDPSPTNSDRLDIDCRPRSRWRFPALERAVAFGDLLIRVGSWFASLGWPVTEIKDPNKKHESP